MAGQGFRLGKPRPTNPGSRLAYGRQKQPCTDVHGQLPDEFALPMMSTHPTPVGRGLPSLNPWHANYHRSFIGNNSPWYGHSSALLTKPWRTGLLSTQRYFASALSQDQIR